MRKPFNDPRVRLALNYAIDKQAFIKVVFSGHADPMDSPMPPLLPFYQKQGSYAIRSGEGEGTAGRGRLPERLRDRRLTGGVQHPDAARHAVRSAAACGSWREDQRRAARGRRADGEDVQRAEAGRCHHRHAVRGWSSSTGDADWGMRPMLYTKSFPPVLSNLAWYSDPKTDAAIEAGLARSIRPSEARPMRMRRAQVWKDAPWIFLGVDHNLAAYSKKLHGAFMRPDQQFHLTPDASLD